MNMRIRMLTRSAVVGPIHLLHGLPVRSELSRLNITTTSAYLPADLSVGVHRRWCEFSVRATGQR